MLQDNKPKASGVRDKAVEVVQVASDAESVEDLPPLPPWDMPQEEDTTMPQTDSCSTDMPNLNCVVVESTGKHTLLLTNSMDNSSVDEENGDDDEKMQKPELGTPPSPVMSGQPLVHLQARDGSDDVDGGGDDNS